MLKKIYLLWFCAVFFGMVKLVGQAKEALPEFGLDKSLVEAQLRFLASDELAGRRTGSVGNNVAAAYIASFLEAYGWKTVPGAEGYYQPVPFEERTPAAEASLTIDGRAFTYKDDYFLLGGGAGEFDTKAIFAGHGWVDEKSGHDDYAKLDVKGKVVVVLPGPPDDKDPLAVFEAMKVKRELAKARGAVGLIELYRLQFPWGFFKSYFGKKGLRLAPEDGAGNEILYAWLKEPDAKELAPLLEGKEVPVKFSSSGYTSTPLPSQNVIGLLEGSDPVLKDEYVLISAHYDHVGTGKDGGAAFTPQDSIFNGARDNAMGVVALLATAKSLAANPPKRSVIFLAVTGEEAGMLGSEYYVENPLIPLEKTVFNFNTDGAGYTDVNLVAAIGYGRTGTDELVEAGAAPFQLEVVPDPAPEQGLFDRSDNVSFSAKGIPSLSYAPGFRTFDEQLMKTYHQVSDEADTVDMDYLLRFAQSFAHTTRLIADAEERPQWKAGDKYEEAGKVLYDK